MKTLHVGFITSFSGRWPRELPEQRFAEYGAWLEGACAKLSHVTVVKPASVINTQAELAAATELFAQKGVDVVVMVYGAFTGDDVSAYLAENLGKPLILWAPYEPPFEKNTRLWANALVALTMNCAALHKFGANYHAVYGSKEDERAASKITGFLSAYAALKKLRGTMLGLFGYRPTAFYNSSFDEMLIRKTFGIRMEETDLKVIFDRMETQNQADIDADMAAVQKKFDTKILPEGHLQNHSKLYLALKQVFAEMRYDFAAIKCWPEMGALKTTPCAVLSRLADERVLIGCEGDIDAEIAQIVQYYLTGLPTFVTDMINIDEKENTMLFWHCGNAALSLMNPQFETTINNHPLAGQGTAFYGSLKTGAVTIARFCNINGVYKLFIVRGEAISAERVTKGVSATIRVKKPVREIIENIIEHGIAHHYSLVWADTADQMIQVAELLGIEAIEM